MFIITIVDIASLCIHDQKDTRFNHNFKSVMLGFKTNLLHPVELFFSYKLCLVQLYFIVKWTRAQNFGLEST